MNTSKILFGRFIYRFSWLQRSTGNRFEFPAINLALDIIKSKEIPADYHSMDYGGVRSRWNPWNRG